MRRYLPAELLFGILRPVLVARYADEQDLSRLASRCGFLFKLNTFSIALIMVVCLVSGNHLFSLLTAGRYPDASYLAVVWFAVFVLPGSAVIPICCCTRRSGRGDSAYEFAAGAGAVIDLSRANTLSRSCICVTGYRRHRTGLHGGRFRPPVWGGRWGRWIGGAAQECW